MTSESEQRLPLLRLAIYVVIVGVCGFVAAWELYYLLGSNATTATVIAVGRTSRTRTATYWADYEYFDEQQNRHVGRASVHPTTNPLNLIDIQYLRHAPDNSRPMPSLAGLLCYGSVAMLAVVVFVGEIVTRQKRRRRARDCRRSH